MARAAETHFFEEETVHALGERLDVNARVPGGRAPLRAPLHIPIVRLQFA
jgi:hypothetical protein